jgi:hypothetical protein
MIFAKLKKMKKLQSIKFIPAEIWISYSQQKSRLVLYNFLIIKLAFWREKMHFHPKYNISAAIVKIKHRRFYYSFLFM